MPAVKLIREAVRTKAKGIETYKHGSPNPGLLLRRGLWDWDPDKRSDESTGEQKAKLLDVVAATPVSEAYQWALRRWVEATANDPFDAKRLKLVGRLYIGLARDNPLETGVTVGHAWGMPLIPGSALKGIARQEARRLRLDSEVEVYLFGGAPPSDDGRSTGPEEESAESGIIAFHDAWWVPQANSKPFVAEIVTPHHREYYNGGEADATDFDSPVPAPQIAVQGCFRFLVEGPGHWRDLAMGLLTRGLTHQGVGGKTTSGYGFFRAD